VKRFLSISLLFLYLLSSAGVTVSAHYCGGDLASLSLFQSGSCCCDDTQDVTDDGCCKDEQRQLKITADQNKAEFSEKKFQVTYHFLAPRGSLHPLTNQFTKARSLIVIALPKAPDKSLSLPAYKRNHSFLFYC
jgi:hypothetical protein